MIKKKYLYSKFYSVILFVYVLIFILFSSVIHGQENKLQFKDAPLIEVIQNLEQASGRVINYIPEKLQGYTYTGKLITSDPSRALNQVLYETPFATVAAESSILIYAVEPIEYRICGTIEDEESRESLVAANIFADDTDIGNFSDTQGYFDFTLTAPKNQKITISYLGYESTTFMVQEMEQGTCPSFRLSLDTKLFDQEILISDYILDGIDAGTQYGGYDLDFNNLSKNHSNVEHDILKTAQLLPGINSIDDSAANLQIRGSNPGQNLILWEGVPLYNAGHVFGMISAINPFSVEKVSIYKGAYDPKYDNRVGGIVDISLADDLVNRFRGSVGTTMTELHSNLSIPIVKDKVTIELAGRQSINGIFNSPTLQSYTDKVFQFSIIDNQNNPARSDRLRTEQTLAYSDWNGKILYRPSDKFMMTGGFYRNAQDFTYSFWFDADSYLSEDKINLNTQIMSLGTELKLTPNWSSRLSLYQSSYSNNYEKIEAENEIIFNKNDQLNRVKEQSFTFSNDVILGSILVLNIGYEYNNKEVILDLGDQISFDSEFDPFEFEQASFHNLFHSFRYADQHLQIEAGNRSSYYQEHDGWFHSPRVNVGYALHKNLKLKADAGVYHQFVSQLTNIGIDQIKVDNPLWILNASGDSLSQKANKIGVGFVYQKGKWLLDVEGFYNRTNNISNVAPQLGVITSENGFSKGSSSILGMDFLLKKRWSSGVNTWLNYSLGFAKYNFPDISNNSFFAPNDIRHNLSFVTSYTYQGFQLSMNTNYHSGLPFSQGQLTLNEDDPNAEPPFLYYLSFDSINNARLSPYVRVDLNLAYRFDVKPIRDSRIEISFSVVNLLNRTNYVARESFVDYNESTADYNLSSIQKALLDRTALLMLRFYW